MVGQGLHNFAFTLPPPQSDLAAQTLKDPYLFDFLELTGDVNERRLELALVGAESITRKKANSSCPDSYPHSLSTSLHTRRVTR